MLRLALRIDKSFDAVKEFIVSAGYSGFAVREVVGDNEHWHWYLEGDKYSSVQSFRVKLVKSVPELRGNGAYSVKQCDEHYEKYWQYMAKGDGEGATPVLSWRHGLLFTDEKMEELHEAYWSVNHDLKRRKLQPVMDEVLERCKRAAVQYHDRRTIFREYIKVLYERNKPINLFSVKSGVNLIILKLCPDLDDGLELLLNQVPLV